MALAEANNERIGPSTLFPYLCIAPESMRVINSVVNSRRRTDYG